MCVLPVYISVYLLCEVPKEARKGHGILVVIWCWELNLGLLVEQLELLTPETSSQTAPQSSFRIILYCDILLCTFLHRLSKVAFPTQWQS